MFKFEIYAGLADAAGDNSPQTVNRNRDKLRHVCDVALKGYTWQECEGRWNGYPEPSVIVTYIADYDAEQLVRDSAGLYKEAASQESVLVTKQAIDGGFV